MTLAICSKCGWHMSPTHERECSPKLGEVAVWLAALLAPIKTTKLGYGFGKLAAVFDDGAAIVFNVHIDGTFDVDHFFWIGRMKRSETAALVRALAGAR